MRGNQSKTCLLHSLPTYLSSLSSLVVDPRLRQTVCVPKRVKTADELPAVAVVGNNKSTGDEAIAEHGLSSQSLLIPGAKQPGGEMCGERVLIVGVHVRAACAPKER